MRYPVFFLISLALLNSFFNCGNVSAAEEPFLLKDINAFPVDIDPKDFVVSNGLIFFTATTPGSGRELWRSDGTELGTYMLKDIAPGAALKVGNNFKTDRKRAQQALQTLGAAIS